MHFETLKNDQCDRSPISDRLKLIHFKDQKNVCINIKQQHKAMVEDTLKEKRVMRQSTGWYGIIMVDFILVTKWL